MGLDFSKLDKLAYRDFDTPEAQQTKDDLIEQGFTIVEDKANPFIRPRRSPRGRKSRRRGLALLPNNPALQDRLRWRPDRLRALQGWTTAPSMATFTDGMSAIPLKCCRMPTHGQPPPTHGHS